MNEALNGTRNDAESGTTNGTVSKFSGWSENRTIIRRFFWREYRIGRSFWIAMLLLTVGMQLLWLVSNEFWGSGTAHASREPLWGIAITMPLIYILGWTATTFSREHETGSFAWLRVLPTTPLPIWLGKLGFTLVSGLLLGLAIAIVTMMFGAVPHVEPLDAAIWLLWALTVAGIGTFCSQWVKRPLTSTFLAGSLLIVVAFWPTNHSISMEEQLNWLNSGLLFIAGLAALVASVPQTRGWLEDRMRWTLRPNRRANRHAALGYVPPPGSGGHWQAQLRRFVWITWRRLGVVGVITLLALLLSVVALEIDLWGLQSPIMQFLILASWPVLLGVTLFYNEQDPVHARFLVGQGISARRVWWLRQLIGASILIGVSVVIISLLIVTPGDFGVRRLLHKTHYVYWAYVIVAYAAGQMVSIAARSTLVGLAIGALIGVAMGAWTVLHGWLEVPWLIAVAIPAVGFLLTSRLRVKSSLLQWNGLRHWLAPVTAFVGTIALTFTAFAVFRATEIPWFDPPFNVTAFTQEADARYNAAAASTIRRAADRLSARPWSPAARYDGAQSWEIRAGQARRDEQIQRERGFGEGEEFEDPAFDDISSARSELVTEEDSRATAWASLPLLIPAAEARAVDDVADILTPQLEAAIRQAYGLWPSSRWNYETIRSVEILDIDRLARLFVARARERQADIDLAEAWSDYETALQLSRQMCRYGYPSAALHASECEQTVLDNLIFWAADPDQSAEQIESMIEWLVNFWRDEPPWVTPLKVEYIALTRFVNELPQSLDALDLGEPNSMRTVYATLLLPGEKARIRRLANEQFGSYIQRFETAPRASFAIDLSNIRTGDRLRWEKWQRTTPLGGLVWSSRESLATDWIDQLQRCRVAALLRLLMIEHRLKNGQYPEPLEQSELPDAIAERARELLDQARPLSVSDGQTFPIVEGFLYRRLTSNSSYRFATFKEPLGSFVVDAEGHLAVISRETCPLPVAISNEK